MEKLNNSESLKLNQTHGGRRLHQDGPVLMTNTIIDRDEQPFKSEQRLCTFFLYTICNMYRITS